MRDPPAGDTSNVDDVTQAQPSTTGPVEIIGPYRLIRRVGEGGMGEVWLAEQTQPIRRQVALKIIKAGMDTAQVVARFGAERQALAVMNHPAIARVFDAGATPQGRPYFAMEYVRGESITAYCDKQKLPLRERIDLFLQVCDGVQHAHQKGIIHRDLKPSNILVAVQDDRAVPKIIDFGVAKATTLQLTDYTLQTEYGALVGTPEYMSPEQAEMTGLDIDTRTDVYALGVVLYELLTGALPFDSKTLRAKPLDEIRRTIREVDPPRPSTRVTTTSPMKNTDDDRAVRAASASELRGDLDWITMRALEKDRTRRYGSASDFAADLRRHLNYLPVLASPPSTAYRVRKFVRRHRFGVTAAAILLVLLVSSTASLAIQARRIARERDRANREAESAKQISDFLVGLFKGSDPSQSRGQTLSARDMLDKGAKQVNEALKNQPAVQTRLQRTLAGVYTELGLYDIAGSLLEDALTTSSRLLGTQHPDSLDALYMLGDVKYYQARYSEAEAAYRGAAEGRARVLGPTARATTEAEMAIASAGFQQKRFTEAESLFRIVLDKQQRAFGDNDPLTLNTLNELAVMYYNQQRYADALPLNRRSLQALRQQLGDDAPRTLGSLHNLATTLDRLGHVDEAERVYRQAMDGKRRVLGRAHTDTVRTEISFFGMYQRLRRYPEAESIALEIHRAHIEAHGADDRRIPAGVERLVALYKEAGRPKDAAEWQAKLPKEPPAAR